MPNSFQAAPGFSALLRGDPMAASAWNDRWSTPRFLSYLGVIVLGAGFYGAAMGWWRHPHQALFVGVKFPLILLLTALGNALINGMLAPLLGLDIPFRRSFSAVVMSFAVTSAILGAFSPVIAFLSWSAPPMSPRAVTGPLYSCVKLTHVLVIAFAGVVGNLRLFQLLASRGGERAAARRVLFAWLAGNLFLGSQLSWILRPFIGSPDLPVEFLRASALRGNFYENVLHSLSQVFN